MDRPGITLKKSYEGAANRFYHLYDTEKSSSALGHMKKQKGTTPWDKQKPRDNSLYNLSETMNLKQEDSEMRDKFKRLMMKQKLQ